MKTNKEKIAIGLFIATWIFATIFFGTLMIGRQQIAVHFFCQNIWTLVDSNIIIEDKQVVNWTNFGIQLVYMAWVAVNKYGSEQMFRNRPMKFRSFWVDYQELGKISEVLKRDFDEDCSIDMPSGTIEKIIGRKLTWDDEPVEI